MINYFDAAENTLRARGMLDTALNNLEKRKERILRYAAPSEYPSADMSKPYTSTRAVNDTLAECVELAETMREIRLTEEKIEEIDRVLGQLEKEDEEIIRLWYIEHRSKEDIAERVSYSSRTSVYDLRNKAVANFALLYFGASAGAHI